MLISDTNNADPTVWTAEFHKRHSVGRSNSGKQFYSVKNDVIAGMMEVTQSDNLELRGKVAKL